MTTAEKSPTQPKPDGPKPDRRADHPLRFEGSVAYAVGMRVTHAAAEANGWLDESTPITTD